MKLIISIFKQQKLQKSANDYTTSSSSRFVSGSIGPGTKLPSLGHISFTKLRNSYINQINGLIDGGVDVLQIETAQDLLQIKAVLAASYRVFKSKNKKLPIIVQVTMQKNGKMLLGTDMLTVIHTFAGMNVDVIGLNCGTGPKDMRENIRILAQNSPKPISVIPNAGLPVTNNGEIVYDLEADEFALELKKISADFGVNIVGGCCGTKFEHIRKLSDCVKNSSPNQRVSELKPSLTSLYNYQPIKVKPRPLLIGEKQTPVAVKNSKNY